MQLNDHDFALALSQVTRLPFVDTCQSQSGLVFIELSPRLTEILPAPRTVLQITRADFSVEEVMRLYKLYCVDHLRDAADLADRLYYDAKKQIRREG